MTRKSSGHSRLLCLDGQDPDGSAEEAISKAWGLRFRDPAQMVEWASLAVELARTDRVRILAHAHLGNAHRIQGNFKDAEYHLRLAEQFDGASAHPLLLEFKGALLENLGDFSEALTCLRAAGRLRSQAGDFEGQAKVLTQAGHVLTEAGQHLEAVRVFRSAMSLIASDRNLLRVAIHGLSHALARSGQPGRAMATLQKAKQLLDEGDYLFKLRVSWLLGRIAMVCGHDQLSQEKLLAAHSGFVSQGLLQEACLTALDLSMLHVRMCRAWDAAVALEKVPEFLSALGLNAEADLAASLRLLLEEGLAGAVASIENLIEAVEARR